MISVGLIAFALLVPRGHAHACNHGTRPSGPKLIAPKAGAITVPRNAIISVFWEAWDVEGATIEVRPIGGDQLPLELEREVWLENMSTRYRPQGTLLANTEYEVVWIEAGPSSDTEQRIGTFVTGSDSDNEPPTEPAALSVEVGGVEECTFEWCCIPDSGDVQQFTISAPETTTSLLFDVYEGERRVAMDATMPLQGFASCSANSRGYEDRVSERPPWQVESGNLTVVAHDTAGNLATPVSIQVAANCDPPDAGCSVDPWTRYPLWLGALFVALSLAGRRRRSSDARP